MSEPTRIQGRSRVLLRALGIGAAVAAVLITGLGTASAGGSTDVLNGRATSGAADGTSTGILSGLPFPIGTSYNPSCFFGLGYAYYAAGRATGSLPGTFTYEERGCLLSDDGAPTGRFDSGVYTIHPRKPGPDLVVSYASVAMGGGVIGKKSAFPPGDQKLIAKLGLKTGQPYMSFTYPGSCGPQTGYASTNYQEIAVEITFACGARA